MLRSHEERLDSSGQLDTELESTALDRGRVLQRLWREAQPCHVDAAGAQPKSDLSATPWGARTGSYGDGEVSRHPVGQSSMDDNLVEFLEQRFYDGFKMWYRRARTLRGRFLVAQTMVLSHLWHYTQHVSIPATVLKRWQSTLNRFALSRKHDRDASHVQLIPQESLYQRRSNGGLGIPSLDAHLKRQRLQLLLQFVSASDLRNWTTASSELLKLVLPRTGGRSALGFLSISPLRHGDMIKWRLTSTWWRAT